MTEKINVRDLSLCASPVGYLVIILGRRGSKQEGKGRRRVDIVSP